MSKTVVKILPVFKNFQFLRMRMFIPELYKIVMIQYTKAIEIVHCPKVKNGMIPLSPMIPFSCMIRKVLSDRRNPLVVITTKERQPTPHTRGPRPPRRPRPGGNEGRGRKGRKRGKEGRRPPISIGGMGRYQGSFWCSLAQQCYQPGKGGRVRRDRDKANGCCRTHLPLLK